MNRFRPSSAPGCATCARAPAATRYVSEATGISASFLSLVESGNDVTISRLARLCGFYGISVADVLPTPSAAAEGALGLGEHQHFVSPAEGIDLSVLGNGRRWRSTASTTSRAPTRRSRSRA